MMNYNSIK